METISEQKSFGGTQGVYRHDSEMTGTPMQFAVYTPPAAESSPVPVLWFLSGLTCTEENFTVKAGAQRYAAEHGIMLVVPDTSPRGAGIEGEDEDYDFGTGAGFYLDAGRPPWKRHYRMYSYIVRELQALVMDRFPADPRRQGISGHSMGGHGALTIGLKHPDVYRSVSAFAPICAPMRVPWGVKAFNGYLGEDQTAWRRYDATALLQDGRTTGPILVDQGGADGFLADQLRPDLLQEACCEVGQEVDIRLQEGYDHSYFFIATFVGDHIRFHRERLG
ncbi:MAG: S-formylglutathione hydrolase [Gammaproteobacteria bacterium]|nr:S-formylglutathione hydrolase [Gammaproteobacteria bacterium]